MWLDDRAALRLVLLRATARLPLAGHRASSPLARPRVLVIRPDHLGDVLFTTPALRRLREALPQAHVAVLCGPWSAAALRGNPNVDALETCPFPGFTRQPKPSPFQPYELLAAEARRLRRQHFDAAVVLRFDHWWGTLLAFAAGIPYRVGYDLPSTRPFLTEALAYAPRRHEVEQNLDLIEHLVTALAVSSAVPVPHEVTDGTEAGRSWRFSSWSEWLERLGIGNGAPMKVKELVGNLRNRVGAGFPRPSTEALGREDPAPTWPVPEPVNLDEGQERTGRDLASFPPASASPPLVAGAAPIVRPTASAGPIEFFPSAADEAAVTAWLAERGIGAERMLIAAHPGAGAPVKRWTPQGFAAVLDAIGAARPAAAFVITGTSSEEDLVGAVRRSLHSAALVAIGLPLGQLGALYRRCRLVVGVDSGALHLAVAVGTPTVHLYGPVDPTTFGPWGPPDRHRVVAADFACAPCNRLDWREAELAAHGCIAAIPAPRVIETVLDLLAATADNATEKRR